MQVFRSIAALFLIVSTMAATTVQTDIQKLIDGVSAGSSKRMYNILPQPDYDKR